MIKFFSSLLFTFVILSSPASATTIISPMMELDADPGTTQPGVVKVYNETNQGLFLVASVEEFTAGDEDGQPLYVPEEDKGDFLSWFNVGEESLVLAPGQASVVPFTVNIPDSAVPGGYYATIFWENVPPQRPDDGNVGVRGKVGTLIFLRVNGDVEEQGDIIEFGTKDSKGIYYKLPLSFVTRIENSGNVHLRPQGKITVDSLIGKKKVFELGDGKGNILPSSTRRFEVVWGQTNIQGNFFTKAWQELLVEVNDFTLGKYTATLDVTYGIDNQQRITKEISFWIIPYHLIVGLIIIIIFLLVASIINTKIKKLKKKSGITASQK